MNRVESICAIRRAGYYLVDQTLYRDRRGRALALPYTLKSKEDSGFSADFETVYGAALYCINLK